MTATTTGTSTTTVAGTTTDTRTTRRPSLAARIVSLPVHAWRLISRWLPPHCRFYPSCSAYALEALEVHGAARGAGLAAKRIGRCHPWHPGGLDPVPAPRDRTTRRTEPNVRSPVPPATRSAETS